MLAGSGVTVNTLLPDSTRTKGSKAMMAGLAAERGVPVAQMEKPAAQHFATLEEVPNMSVTPPSTVESIA